MEYPEALGEVIREARSAKGLTQERLGSEVGYGAGAAVAISRVENGVTRPRPDRLARLEKVLGFQPGELIQAAARWTEAPSVVDAKKKGERPPSAEERLRTRARRVQQQLEGRRKRIGELADRFTEAHDRARDEYFMPFIEIAEGIDGRPRQAPGDVEAERAADAVSRARSDAERTLLLTSLGISRVLAEGATETALRAAVNGASSYQTLMTAISLAAPLADPAISGLSRATASRATRAWQGGGTLSAGGAGIVGGRLLLTALAAAPAALIGIGAIAWVAKRTKEQQRELTETLDEAEVYLAVTQSGFDALGDILPRATETLEYIAIHAGHALARWEAKLPSPSREWADLKRRQQSQYDDFVTVSACQLSLVSIDVFALMESRGDETQQLIDHAKQILEQARSTVEEIV